MFKYITVNLKLNIMISIILLISLAVGYVLLSLYAQKIEVDTNRYFVEQLQILAKEKIKNKKHVGVSNAISIANSESIKQALKQNNRNLAIKNLENLSKNLKTFTPFKNTKVHIHTKDNRSFIRSWKLDKYGDDLSNFRDSVVKVNKTKKVINTFEIGKMGLSLRSIVPVMDYGVHLGSLEFIQGINSVAKSFDKADDASLLLMDKRVSSVELFNKEKVFKTNYIISQQFINQEFLADLENVNMEQFLKNAQYKSEKYLYTYNKIEDSNSKNIGIIIVASTLQKVNIAVDHAKELIDMFLYIMIALMAVISIALVVLVKIVIIRPLVTFQEGLNLFFDYLKDSTKKIKKIDVDTDDEIGQMCKATNESINISMRMHAEISNLMNVMDKNVITSETDDKGIITYVSEAFCKVSGYTKEELLGQQHNMLRHPDMPSSVFKDLWETLKANKTWEGEVKNLKKSGEFYWVYTIISPKCTESGASCGFTAIRYDITDKKAVEDLSAHLEEKVKERTEELHIAKQEIEATHKHTRDSIEYAALIQSALLPDESMMKNYFQDYFVHWMPKDTVGGDIWLFNELRDEDECLLFYIDCTGHGVPGAFVTMIVKAIEREIVTKIKENRDMDVSPAWVMSYFNKTMKILLKQETAQSMSNAGWDGGIIYYNKKDKILKFSGAETPLFYVDTDGTFNTLKGNRYSVGYKKCEMDYEYKESVIEVKEGMKFYCTTDGYLDQNGGEKGFPFNKKRFKSLISENYKRPMSEQKEVLIDAVNEYEAMVENNDRNDDMTVIGFEI